jgi:integral membrane protein (TIGR01906 family)
MPTSPLSKFSKPWSVAASWIATLLVPIVLLFFGLRIVASNFFLDVEYRLPNFPADTYGFTLEQRLEYAGLCLRYLTTSADISLLADLTFEDGSPLFNARELSHMEDVKAVFVPATNLGFGLTLVLFGLLLVAQRRPWRADVIAGIRRGGWLTLGLIAVIGIFAAFSFWTFFESFHALFFEGDSWIFLYSDTLIRLFPVRFWQDAVLWLFGIAGGLGLLLGLLLRPKGKPKAR